MATLDLDAVELHYDDRGEGIPAFLFISGEASNRRNWQPQIEDLSRDHRCVAYDRRGTGDSSATQPFSLAQDVDDAEALVRALGLERLIVVGHRLGGLTALLLNERLPDVIVGVVIGDTPLSPHGIRPADLAQLVRSAPNPAALAEHFTASTTSAEARTAVIEAFGSSSPGPSADFVESCELDGDRIRELVRAADRKPFMALWPAAAVTDGTLLSGDPVWLRDVAMFIRQEPVPNSSHFFQLEQPAITNALLRAFLDDVERDPRLPPQ